MVFGLSWWVWLLVLAAVALVVVVRAAKGWRASVRAEFVAYLGREAPEFEIVAARDREIDIRGPGGAEGTLRLDRLFTEVTNVPAGDSAAREAVFAHFLKALREGKRVEALDAARDRPSVRARIISDDFLGHLRADGTRRTGKTLSAVPLGVAGLSVVFVLDNENSVAYLTDDLLAELNLTAAEALVLAKENLARTLDLGAVVRAVLSERSMNVLKAGDTYDAARLLLVADLLQEGEQVAVVIPDRDTLAVTSVPADGDWSGLRKLARSAAGPVLWDKPLLVTRAGIAAAPEDAR